MEGTLTLPLPVKEAIFNDPNQKGNYELQQGAEVKFNVPSFGGMTAL